MESPYSYEFPPLDNNISRKRSRSNTPTPKATSGQAFDPNTPNTDSNSKAPQRGDTPSAASQAIVSRLLDSAQRNGALNELLRASAVNYALDGDIILEALTEVVFDSLAWDPPPPTKVTSAKQPIFDPQEAWAEQPTQDSKEWAKHCEDCFNSRDGVVIDPDKLKCVEAVVVILRNLSFSAANGRLLAFSPDVLAVLVGCLYEGTFSSSPANMEDSASAASSVLALPAMHALVNIAPHLDVTGQKLFCDKLFFKPQNDDAPLMPNPSSFGQAADGVWGFGSMWLSKRLDAKEDVMTDIPESFLLEITNASDFLVQVWSIFPALTYVFDDPKSSRALLMMAVDLVQEFVNHARVGAGGTTTTSTAVAEDIHFDNDNTIPSARSILVNMPDVVLERFIDFLYVPRLGPDCMAYEDPTTSIVTRVNYFKLMMTYEANVDTDLRDRSLDVLVPILEMDSPRMALKLGVNEKGVIRTRLYDALVPVIAGGAGRNESAVLASQMLKELANAGDENKVGLEYIQGRLIEMASRDPRASQLALTHLYPAASTEKDATAPVEQVDQI